MALEIEHYTDAAGRDCMRLRQVEGDDPAPSNVTPLRAGQVLAHPLIPIEAARGTTRSAIVHFPTPAPTPRKSQLMSKEETISRIVLAMTPAEKHQCRMLNVAPADWAEQRMLELATGNTNGVNMADVPRPERK